MKFNVKTLAIGSILLSGVLLTGCQSEPNTLSFTPATPQATMNVNQSAVVFVSTRDMRQAPEISSYVADGKVVKLSASPSVTELFQQVEQQNLISKGFRIGMANNSNAAVTVDVQEFIAKVNQGNLRYDIDSKIQLAIQFRGAVVNLPKISMPPEATPAPSLQEMPKSKKYWVKPLTKWSNPFTKTKKSPMQLNNMQIKKYR